MFGVRRHARARRPAHRLRPLWQPWLVRYPARGADCDGARRGAAAATGCGDSRPFLPLLPGEEPVTLGEGDTPLLHLPRTGAGSGVAGPLAEGRGDNPTGSFKARGLSAAITRAVAAGATRFVLPTAGNAGVARRRTRARAGVRARVFAPRTHAARPFCHRSRPSAASSMLLDGHIGDCGQGEPARGPRRTARTDLSTLREPYRIEGKKTLAFELAVQLGWTMPDAIIYPTGGGTGLIGMWKAFAELLEQGWVRETLPRFYSVQSTGCAPVVRAFEAGADRAEPWPDPRTVASGLRVPAPLGDRLMLRALRESGGGAIAVTDDELTEAARTASGTEGNRRVPGGWGGVRCSEALAPEWDTGTGIPGCDLQHRRRMAIPGLSLRCSNKRAIFGPVPA